MDMTGIAQCNMDSCAYNSKMQCHTKAITVGPHAECNTYVHASARGGFDELRGGIGSCLASDCSFNSSLECCAPSVEVSGHDKHADCTTFENS